MTRVEMVSRLRHAATVAERVRVLIVDRRTATDVRAIDAELHQLKDYFRDLVGGAGIPEQYLTRIGLTRIADVIEEERADSVRGAIRVLQDDHEAVKERAHRFQLGLLRQEAQHQQRMYADQVDWYRTRSIVRAFRGR
ncbi:hypothetical protein [Gordonia sp. 852002-51296_SCH5728562-b]|uniref:hypothetical protein n=1 Tax=Gordonia sp. 852002-51296_SCH5728562-b TaxID=1834101 RepID=UPI000B0BBDD9|nr:hypothetical protein [Gordonia sp. 852002-51296_SCH5728562-b]